MKALYLLFALHFIADFLLQSREMGKTKSSDNWVLFTHVYIIYVVVFLGMLILVPTVIALKVAAANCIIHGLVDKYIWNIYKIFTSIRLFGIGNLTHSEKQTISKGFKYWEDKYFYATIGFDQMLHAMTLIFIWGVFVNV